MSEEIITYKDLNFFNINGHRVTQAYDRDFIEIFHHNSMYQHPFVDFKEANY